MAVFGLHYFVARVALIKKLAIVNGHRYSFHMAAVRALQIAFALHVHTARLYQVTRR